MSIEVYWISGSAPAWRVLLMLEIKQLEYASHLLQTSKQEQKQAWFLELNPRGQIPVLKDNGVVVSESLAIMHYLERKYSDPALFGTDPAHTARVEQTIQEILAYVDKPIADVVQPIFRNKVEENRTSLEKAAETSQQELRLIENKLTQQVWLAGPEISAADIVLVPTMQRLLRAVNKEPRLASNLGLASLDAAYPALHSWNKRIEALPAFTATFPPHWRT